MAVQRFLQLLLSWAWREPKIQSVLLVGSYARGTQGPSSDLDLILLTPDRPYFLAHPSFLHQFGPVQRIRKEAYGACTSLRVWYASGLEVEFGFVTPAWMARPLDQGTEQVLRGGYLVLLDKGCYFQSLSF